MKTLIVLDNAEFADEIAKKYAGSTEVMIIAFSIATKLALDQRNIPSLFPDDLIKLPNVNQMGIDNWKRTKQICRLVDEALQQRIDALAADQLNIVSSAFFSTKVFLDTACVVYEVLNRILKSQNFTEVIFYADLEGGNVISPKRSVVTALLRGVFQKKDAKMVCVEKEKRELENLKGHLRHNLYQTKEFLVWLTKHRNYSANYFILANAHDISYVKNDILKAMKSYLFWEKENSVSVTSNGRNVIVWNWLEDREIKTKIRDVFSFLLEDEDYLNIFQEDRLFVEFVSKQIEQWIVEELSGFLRELPMKIDNIKSIDAKFLLTSHCRLTLKQALFFECVKSLQTPVISYQEGGGAGYITWPLFDLDVEMSDFFLVYGKGVGKNITQGGKAKVVPVGSMRLNMLRKEVSSPDRSSKKIYVVLDTIKVWCWQHYPYNGGFFSESYKNQLQVLESLKQFKDVNFVIKTVKGRESFYRSYIDSTHMTISTEPLTKVFCDASGFIIEYPSTVLQECLLTDKPIALLYSNENVDLEMSARTSLSRRVHLCAEPNCYSQTIARLITDIREGSTMTNDTEFFDEYCKVTETKKNLKSFFNQVNRISPINQNVPKYINV